MEDWKEYKLGDICTKIGSGATPKGGKEAYLGGRTSLIRSQNVLDFSFSWDGLAYINDEQASKLKGVEIEKGDVLLNITGDSVARVCMVPDSVLPARVNQHVAIIRGDRAKVFNEYILYYLQYKKPYLLSLSQGGATRNALTKGMIEELIIPLPEITKQEAIVEILKSLDDKIECNRRINENLEQQAQALFKSWFVDFEPFKDQPFVESELGMIPQGWKVVSIGELPLIVTDYVANGSFASLKENVKLYQEEEYAYFIRNTDLKSGDFGVFVDKHSYDFLSKSRLFGGEIIISNVGDVGSVFLCPRLNKPMTLGNNIIMVKSEDDLVNSYLYILFRWSYGQGLIQSITGGSAQPKFNKTDFKSLKLIMPSESIVTSNVSKLRSMIDVMESNKEENKRLAELRDTLLPKLMSGELKVGEINV